MLSPSIFSFQNFKNLAMIVNNIETGKIIFILNQLTVKRVTIYTRLLFYVTYVDINLSLSKKLSTEIFLNAAFSEVKS